MLSFENSPRRNEYESNQTETIYRLKTGYFGINNVQIFDERQLLYKYSLNRFTSKMFLTLGKVTCICFCNGYQF